MSFSELYPPLASLLALLSISSFYVLIKYSQVFVQFPLICILQACFVIKVMTFGLWQSYYTFNANNQVASSDIFYIGFTNLFSILACHLYSPSFFVVFSVYIHSIICLNILMFPLFGSLFLTSVIIVVIFSTSSWSRYIFSTLTSLP